ncbi:hypothetical protein HDV00_003314 [Rhizophlyctis rosea]|nr:hypothetical protein HDV00_003314 [Rhizophlyctis rosea]
MSIADIPPELLTHIFAKTPLPSLLICEGVSKQWSTLIRIGSGEQIWRPKLVAAYPDGCVPVLRGRENWRDVAIVAYAWGRSWDPRRVEGRVEDLGSGQQLERREKRVFRDLTNCMGWQGYNDWDLLGCFPSGEVLRIMELKQKSPQAVVDRIFSNSPNDLAFHLGSLAHDDLEFSPYHVRANAFACKHESRILSFANYPNGNIHMDCQRNLNQYTYICGDHIFQFESFESTCANLTVSSLRDPSFHYNLPSCPWLCFNESLVAYGTIASHQTESVQLVRLRDQKQLSTYLIDGYIAALEMSRFNLFVCYWARDGSDDWIDVMDFWGRHLYSIGIPQMNWKSVRLMWDREVIIMEDFESVFTVLDAVEGTSRRVVVKDVGEESEANRDEYCFTVMEYPTDDHGERTGGRGVMKCYRRRIERVLPA